MRRNLVRFPLLLVCAICCTCHEGLRADTITLNDGTVVEGAIVEENAEQVVVKLKFGKVSYKRAEIREIVKSSEAAAKSAGDLRDIVKLKSGEEQHGLIVEDNDKQVVIDLIMAGKHVSKTMFVRTTYLRGEVEEVRPLTSEQRAGVRAWFEKAQSQAQTDTLSEQSLKVEAHEWPAQKAGAKIPCRKVELEHFTIEANTSEEFLRKAAYRLGKVYNAYKDHFGVERNQGQKIRVVLFNSMEQYQAAIGGAIKNPAFYAPDLKLISAGCEVAKYEALIKDVRRQHGELDKALEGWKKKIDAARADIQAQVSRYYELANKGGRGITPENKAVLDAIQGEKTRAQLALGQMERKATEIQDEIHALNRRNDVVFQEIAGQMFATLYHEGFHAFLDNFLFPEELRKNVPLWLNEGLAQYFEAARIENNRFVLGQEDRIKMAILRKWNKASQLVPLASLAVAESKEFLVQDMSNAENSTKHYLQAWALVHMLGEKNRLTMPVLREYVQSLKGGKPPLEALPVLTGTKNEELQKAWENKLLYAHEKMGLPEPGAKP